ncbi:MAG: ATP-binding protein, partial [Candidatus Omnitrophota bacterium]
GKTTLVKMLQQEHNDSLYLNCDEIDIREKLSNKTSTELSSLVSGKKLVIIDEAQRVQNIGLTLKIITDSIKGIQVIATGSSSFELSDKIKEPLTGRAYEFHLYPFSVNELKQIYQEHELTRLIENMLIYGMYPEVVFTKDKKILTQLADSYLYKDILNYQNIKNHDILIRLLQALALQIGNEVSYNEISSIIGIDKKTVANYINILEQAFIIFRLCPFSRNLRNELKKLRKIYFYDLGIRNSLINNFNPLSMRQDTGALFENFIISERLKYNHNNQIRKNIFFWRTHQQKEIDYIEEEAGKLNGYEIKYSQKGFKKPKEFLETYENSSIQLINKENFLDYLT